MDLFFTYGGLTQTVFFVVFALAVIFFVVGLVRNIGRWHQNNVSPRLTVDAVVADKRTEIIHHHQHQADGMDMVHTTTDYFVTFQVESGDRMEFCVPSSEYGMLVQGDRGRLSFQGTRYLGFERN